jgi:hypothetical protein
VSRAKTAVAKTKPVIELGETDPNLLAEAIVSVASGAKKLLASGLTKEALVVLIQHKCGGNGVVSRGDIVRVLDAAADLGSFVKR